MAWLLIVIGILALAALYFVGVYNGLVRGRNQKDNAWSQIDVQLKRRYDLIPNLVETVKGYAKHERETLDAVIKARNQAVSAQGPAATGQA
jgi:LemA protein